MSEVAKGAQDSTTKVVGAMQWSIELRSQSSRAYMKAFFKVKLVVDRQLKIGYHIAVATADDAVMLRSRDGIPITRQEMETIFSNVQKQIGIMAVGFERDSKSPIIERYVKNAQKVCKEVPAPVETHMRKEPKHSVPVEEHPQAAEPPATMEAPKSELELKLEELEKQRKSSRAALEEAAAARIECIKERAISFLIVL